MPTAMTATGMREVKTSPDVVDTLATRSVGTVTNENISVDTGFD